VAHYHILAAEGDLWRLVGTAEAKSKTHALQDYITDDSTQEFVVLPSYAWKPRSVRLEQRLVVVTNGPAPEAAAPAEAAGAVS
jgi:hypothetical protein